MEQCLQTSVSKGVGLIEFCRPHRYNSWTQQQSRELIKALAACEKDEKVVVVVLTGQGKYYSSGAELQPGDKGQPQFMNTAEYQRKRQSEGKESAVAERPTGGFVRMLIDFPKPIIAAINGAALGVAVTTMSLCDIVYASDTATFRTPFMELGFCAEGCSSVIFPEIMGPSKANEMLLLGKQISAQEAERCGLVSEVFPHDAFRQEVMKRAEHMASFSVHALIATKGLIRNAKRRALLHEINVLELDTLVELFQSADCKESIAKFIAKQKERKQQKRQSKL